MRFFVIVGAVWGSLGILMMVYIAYNPNVVGASHIGTVEYTSPSETSPSTIRFDGPSRISALKQNALNIEGGGHRKTVLGTLLKEYHLDADPSYDYSAEYVYVRHRIPGAETVSVGVESGDLLNDRRITCKLPLHIAVKYVTAYAFKEVLQLHGIDTTKYVSIAKLTRSLRNHSCSMCFLCRFEFEPYSKMSRVASDRRYKAKVSKSERVQLRAPYPPKPPSMDLMEETVKGFCESSSPTHFEEAGCMVCGELTLLTRMTGKHLLKDNIDLLIAPEVTRIERRDKLEPLRYIQGPVVASGCRKVCPHCVATISNGVIPDNALSTGLWLGDVPDALRHLRFAEKLLISRVRHNCCVGRVASGGHKLMANAVMFASPLPKIYKALPPPKDDLDDILAVIFTGPCKPTAQELARSPFLVRRKIVRVALDWLKLNHADYLDIDIDSDALNSYPESDVPVSIEYNISATNKIQEGSSIFDMNGENGTSLGTCPFAVHGLTEHSFESMTMTKLKTVALNYLNAGGKMLAIGHSERKESIYDNPHLYPSMFPWLFPYGLGGVGAGRLSTDQHVKHLLMYHDKRFQTDSEFPLIAFNHQQIKKSTNGSFMFVRHKRFEAVKNRLLSIDTDVVSDLATRMSVPGSVVLPTTDQETACFELLKDMDIFGGELQGSLTAKKNMRSQLWSLMTHVGAPSWYITISPADTKHPMCIYLADTKEKFQPDLSTHEDSLRLVTNNPVAGARFFDFMIRNFIKHILGVDNVHDGLYGPTSAYYGTVEQQGRLTLHLHLLLWIRGSLSPSVIRQRLNDPDGLFRKAMIAYLEGSHTGDFLSGVKDDVKRRVDGDEKVLGYADPTRTLPVSPASACRDRCKTCPKCLANETWWSRFKKIVDDIVLRSNVHTCTNNKDLSGQIKKTKTFGGCINIWGACKARFPRDTFQESTVDDETGHITLKKLESSINTYSPVLSYISRSNTDVCSLLSGTAIKAVIAYVTDYVTKSALKTHVVFATICSVFERNKEMLQGSLEQNEKARRVMNKIVNSVAAKMEIGAPMASLYLMGLPDHYTSHSFFTYSWKPFVHESRKCFLPESAEQGDDYVAVRKWKGRFIGVSPVLDYVYRPVEYNDITLYDWMRLSRKTRVKSIKECEAEELESDPRSDDDGGEDLDSGGDETDGGTDVAASNAPSCAGSKRGRCGSESALSTASKIRRVSYGSSVVGGAPKGRGYKFLEGHPLYDTHQVVCVEPREDLVPNLVGGPLPRADTGDIDYYAATVLTLFKPWRTGRDLKTEDHTWEDAYAEFVPSTRQSEIIQNMNLRYECLDARDNYSAELKKKGVPCSLGISTYWNKADNLIDLDDETMVQRTLDRLSGADGYDEGSLATGQTGVDQDRQLASMAARLEHAGWNGALSAQSKIDLRTSADNTEPDTFPARHPATWKTLIDVEKQNVLDNKRMHMRSRVSGDTSQSLIDQHYRPDYVKVVDKSFLLRDFQGVVKETKGIADNLVETNSLNEEQERAFRIITNHSVMPVQNQQLLMYVAGMGGTGKTRVINTVLESFRARDQQYRFLVVAPTGTAAALLGGCTYQSLLGMRDRDSGGSDRLTDRTLSIIREKLEGVDYIFFDEVSMLSKRDLTKIHTRLSLALNNSERPFGGINMIFAGDFAQLPPVIGKESGSLYGASSVSGAGSMAVQEAALGRSIWHQVNVVVILRQNMRQKTQTPADAKLRTALENMRYKACTTADLVFLRSLIARGRGGGPQLSSLKFRHHSIITARNLSKDEVNARGSRRFAEDYGHQMYSFYSIDTLSGSHYDSDGPSPRGKKKKMIRLHSIDDDIRNILWNRPCACTEKLVSGRLDLCLNMPVMIRSNAPTELCITNGQEGTVAGWSASMGPHGMPVLDVLFVRLKSPPQRVQIADLPVGIVPVVRTKTPTLFTAPSGHSFRICREQVQVLPNFAMTDYASQGKTREKNMVDLQQCDTHQSYYTCLSRSASAANTAIIGGFDPDNITGGCSGWLRQEFRHLEILNDITKLKYEGKLPATICGERRKSLIQQYQQWKGTAYVPKAVHAALVWVPKDLSLDLEDHEEDRIERDVSMSERTGTASAPRYLGTSWDPTDFSCAYDSSLTILHKMWLGDTGRWNSLMREWNPHMATLADGFRRVLQGQTTLDAVRDAIRATLHRTSPVAYPYGRSLTSVVHLLADLFESPRDITVSLLVCHKCNNGFGDRVSDNGAVLHATIETPGSVQQWANNIRHSTHHICPLGCRTGLEFCAYWQVAPPWVVFDFSNRTDILVSLVIQINVQGLPAKNYKLVGVIYYGGDHFTSRLIHDDDVCYYDGAVDPHANAEGVVSSVTFSHARDGRRVLCAVYAAQAL